ncbi:NADH-ubiquinone oxidoreductase chain 4L, partial [Lemmus lemmus]
NITLAFKFSFLGILISRSHLISTLLGLDGIRLLLFILATIIFLNNHSIIIFLIPIIILVFMACEAVVGLPLLAKISNT